MVLLRHHVRRWALQTELPAMTTWPLNSALLNRFGHRPGIQSWQLVVFILSWRGNRLANDMLILAVLR